MTQPTNFGDVRNNCGKVLDYLRGLGNLGRPPHSNFERAVEWWRYGSELRGLPGIGFNGRVGGEEAWLTVARPEKIAPPPPLPNPLKGWVNDPDNPEKELVPEKIRELSLAEAEARRLLDAGLARPANISADGETRMVTLHWRDDAPANRAWKTYLPKWRKWRDLERPKRRAIAVYDRLHGDLLAMEGKRESIRPLEILFGMGIAKLHSGDSPECNCIVVEQAAELEMDARTSVLIVRPRRGRHPAVSLEHFHKNPRLAKVESALDGKIADGNWELNPHDEDSFLPVVESACSYLDSRAQVRRDVDAPNDKPKQLTFYPEWAVVVRNREEAGILSNVVKSFKRALDAAESLNDIPDALVRAASGVSTADSWTGKNPLPFRGAFGEPPKNHGASSSTPEAEKLYFPLSCNEEQRRIMTLLRRPACRGVVVQGPPGTGKSHTIANIISHCLATGQKVLVASHNSPALEVVREKIPEGIRTFAIPVLSTEKKSREEIVAAINALEEVRAGTDVSSIGAEIERLEKEAERLRHGGLPRMRDEMLRLAERQLSPLPGPLAAGLTEPSPARLAQWVAENRNCLGWFRDSPKVETLESMPIDDSDIRRLRDARCALGDDLSPKALTAATREAMSANGDPDIGQMNADRLEVERVPWAASLLRDRLAGNADARHWSEHRNELRDLARQRDGIAQKPVDHPDLEAALSNEARGALEGKAKLISLPILSGEVRSILNGFRVEGRKPRGADWRLARDYIRWLIKCRAFAVRWNANVAPDLSGRGARAPKSPKQYFVWVRKSDDILSRMESVLGIVGELRGQVAKIARKIEQAGAAQWAAELQARPVVGNDPLLPENWRDAWRWGCANRHLDETDGGQRMRQLADDVLGGEDRLARLMGEIVEKRAAEAITRELDKNPEAASNLTLFQTAMRGIPKDPNAKNAPRFRKMAQSAMEKCRRTIPCWIMPSWKANEMLPAEFGSFDLVIVDEASQSDITEIATLSRGKRVLVVGDNEQVSPVFAGQTVEDIENLWRAHVDGVGMGRILQPPHSLYDFSKSAYPGSFVMLREHFRCAEPIIAFCSREFYEGKIQALRVPKAIERLAPPLISVHVPNGYRVGYRNELEAREIVEEIERVISNPQTKSRTIGVVSLIGEEQARVIFEMALGKFGEKALRDRAFECGNAAHFQGKERDIVFLSMVASPGEGASLTSRVYQQRFNVAVSRARDRLYLFHSIGLEELDNQDDLRRRLLEHFRSPMPEERAKNLRNLCESGFEREFFDRLSAKGYAATPQVGSRGYRIDIVVEGENGARLAIELDGDKFHQDWAKDYARQQNLERVGWRFWRCFESSYRRDPDRMFADLISTLRDMGIEPWHRSEDSAN